MENLDLSMELIQLKDYKKSFEYDLMTEIDTLKKVQSDTWDQSIRDDIKNHSEHLTDTSRSKKHRDNIIVYSYIKYYLMNFMKDRPKTFDVIYKYISDYPTNYISMHTLKELSYKL